MSRENHSPRTIGVILDGNRRYAKTHNLPSFEGHRRGAENVRSLVHWCRSVGVEEVIVYAFSTENWNRTPEEVSYLMELFNTMLDTIFADLNREGIRIRFIGERERFSNSFREKMRTLEEETENATGPLLAVALSYGGRSEIIHAVKALLSTGSKEVTEEQFENALWTNGLHDPDLIIRTGGEKRLSNFLPWQSTYSELFFSDTPWPAFSETEFLTILEEFAARERRRGR